MCAGQIAFVGRRLPECVEVLCDELHCCDSDDADDHHGAENLQQHHAALMNATCRTGGHVTDLSIARTVHPACTAATSGRIRCPRPRGSELPERGSGESRAFPRRGLRVADAPVRHLTRAVQAMQAPRGARGRSHPNARRYIDGRMPYSARRRPPAPSTMMPPNVRISSG